MHEILAFCFLRFVFFFLSILVTILRLTPINKSDRNQTHFPGVFGHSIVPLGFNIYSELLYLRDYLSIAGSGTPPSRYCSDRAEKLVSVTRSLKTGSLE